MTVTSTNPINVLTGQVGPGSKVDYLAAVTNQHLGLPRITSVSPGEADSANPDTYAFTGEEIIQPGWKQAQMIRDAGVANASIVWQSVQPGEDGNDITIVFTADGAPVHISVAGHDITVKLQTGVTSATAVIAELALETTASQLVQATLAVGHTGAGLPTTGAVANLTGGSGRALRRSSLQIGPSGGGNNAIIYTSRRPGVEGNDISVEYLNTLGSNILPVVTVTGKLISVRIFAGTTTSASVLRALWGSTAAMNLVAASVPYGDNRSGTPAASAELHLVNGDDGDAVSVIIGGAACDVTNIQHDAIAVTAPAIAEATAKDIVLAEINICGFHQTLPMVAK